MSRCCRSRNYYLDPGPEPSTVIAVIISLIFIGWFFVGCNHVLEQSIGAEEYVIATVTDKGIKRNGNSDIYLIYTQTIEGSVAVFEITDSVLSGRFNSSDVYADIEVGKSYKLGIKGQRNPIMSWYPNIYDYEEVDVIR